MIRPVIDREQVLHVAKLARLKLSDEEIERMSRELSGILEHVERISELDLEGVEPTSHVVELENVLRPDEPRPSWDRERVLEPAPEGNTRATLVLEAPWWRIVAEGLRSTPRQALARLHALCQTAASL